MTTTAARRCGMVIEDDQRELESLRQQPPSPASSRTESEGSYAEIFSDEYHSEGDDIAEYWDPYLYRLQLQAPKPKCVPCDKEFPDKPDYYGPEYHGSISREETARILGNQCGNYLVRRGLSTSGSYSLSFLFEGQVRHYRLYHNGQDHYVGEKTFETIEDLVEDGLITLYMEFNNVEEYLRSAREREVTQRRTSVTSPLKSLSTIAANGPVFEEDEELEELSSAPAASSRDCMPRQPPYYPPSIPQLRDSTNTVEAASSSSPLYESVPDEDKLLLQQGFVPTGHLFEATKPDSLCINRRKDSSLYFHYEKPHNFKLHNYRKIMAWCDYCRNFMWGLRNQGYKCIDCGYNTHKQCKDETASDCQPSRQLIKRVYGVELTTLVKMQGTKVPVVVKDTIEEIERRGLATEGLYRISGKSNEVLGLKKEFDHDMCANLADFEDTHVLTGALKLYLRELPVPLMTFDAYDLCLIAARTNSLAECLEMLKVALGRLPPAHYNTLRHLLRHLHKVQQFKSENRMDARNLAVVFTPSLMRSPYNTGFMAVQKLPEQKKAVEMLITHFSFLFD